MRTTYKVASRKRRKKILKRAKGFGNGRRLYRKARETLLKAGAHAYRGRKERKRNFRRLWITRISAALSQHNTNYSQFIKSSKEKEIILNRKMLSEIAISDPLTFNQIIKKAIKK